MKQRSPSNSMAPKHWWKSLTKSFTHEVQMSVYHTAYPLQEPLIKDPFNYPLKASKCASKILHHSTSQTSSTPKACHVSIIEQETHPCVQARIPVKTKYSFKCWLFPTSCHDWTWKHTTSHIFSWNKFNCCRFKFFLVLPQVSVWPTESFKGIEDYQLPNPQRKEFCWCSRFQFRFWFREKLSLP